MRLYGAVNRECEATVPIEVVSASDTVTPVTAVIDTGYNGYLTLPAALIDSLGLAFNSIAATELGDGREVVLRKFECRVRWFGRLREVVALETNSEPLVGMALLRQRRLTVDVVPGGEVAIGPLD